MRSRAPNRRSRLGVRRPGTAARLLALHTVVLVVVLGVVLDRVVADFSAHYRRTLETDLVEELSEYTRALNARGSGVSLSAASAAYLRAHPLPTDRVLLISLRGHWLEGSPGARALVKDPPVAHWLVSPPSTTSIATTTSGDRSTVLASPIRAGGRSVGLFVAGADLSHLTSARRQVLYLAGAEAAIALGVTLLSTYLLLRRVLRTVGKVTAAAEEISLGDLDRRLGDPGPGDEVGRLAQTFDLMLGRISAGVAAQRELLSDVSHQLRTPLTVVRGHLEVLRRGGCSDPYEVDQTIELVVDELDQMRVLVDRLLMLGRALEPDFISPEPVDLRSFLADLLASATVLADREWSLGTVPDLVVLADAQKLRGALWNLIDNAVRATGVGDRIELGARLAAGVELTVADSGRGMTKEQVQLAFERFARPGALDSEGSGLGLAIVKAVAEGHRGSVRVESALGRGSRVTVVLPRSCVRLGDVAATR